MVLTGTQFGPFLVQDVVLIKTAKRAAADAGRLAATSGFWGYGWGYFGRDLEL